MSDQELYGQEATEAKSGNFPLHPDPPAEDVTLTPQQATDAISQQPRPEEEPTVVRNYYQRNEQGQFTTDDEGNFKPERSRGYVSVEEAGRDLNFARDREAAALREAEQKAIQDAVDAIRSGTPSIPMAEQQSQQPTQQPYQQQPPEYNQQQQESAEQLAARIQQQPGGPTAGQVGEVLTKALSEIDEALSTTNDINLVAALQNQRMQIAAAKDQHEFRQILTEHPNVGYAIEQELAKGLAAAHQQAQNAVTVTQNLLLRDFPELGNVTNENLPMAMEVLKQSNPDRFAAMQASLGHYREVLGNALQVSQQHIGRQQAEAQRQWTNYASQQDEAFIEAHPEMRDPAVAEKVNKQAWDYLKSYGLSNQDIAAVGNSRMGRSAAFQNILYEAISYRNAKAGVERAYVKPAPVRVQRPGSAADSIPRSDFELSAMEKRLSSSGNLKDGAELLAARRANRR